MPLSSDRNFGFAFSLFASIGFAVLYYYSTLLHGMNAEQILGWRIVLTLPGLTVVIVLAGKGREIIVISKRIKKRPLLLLPMMLSAALLGSQLWVFMWAPVNGYGLDVSLGFLILPLALVSTGRLFFGEKVSRLQAAACGAATLGVISELFMAGGVTWATALVVMGYPIYFSLRRILNTANLGGLFVDMILCAPAGIWFIVTGWTLTDGMTGEVAIQLFGLGAISCLSLACMFLASQLLSLGLYGLMNYVEPLLLVAVSLSLGERIAPNQFPTYGLIAVAIIFVTIDTLCAKSVTVAKH